MPDNAVNGRVCDALDEENAFAHVAICYISEKMRDGACGPQSGGVLFRKDGFPDMRTNIGRLMWKLNRALGGEGIPLNKKDWEK